MKRRAALLLLAATAPVLPFAKKTREKGPEVELLESSAKVEEGNLVVDGRVKNISERPIRKLTIIYDILDSDKQVLTRQKGQIEEDEVAPGDEAGFHVQMKAHARAIAFRLSFEDVGERELRAENTGPFPIE